MISRWLKMITNEKNIENRIDVDINKNIWHLWLTENYQ